MTEQPHKNSGLLASFAEDRDIGARANQEDYAMCVPVGAESSPCGEVICALADGMGGLAAGEVASRVSVSAFCRVLKSMAVEPGQEAFAMVRAAQEADEALHRRLMADAGASGNMGCTLCAVWIKNGQLHFINIGDSLIYFMRDKRLYRLNHRHNHREDMRLRAEREGLNWAEVSQMESVVKYGSRVTSYLSGRGIDQAHCPKEPLMLEPGDTILLASDGILTLSEMEIAQALLPVPGRDARGDAEAVLECVLSKEAPRQDNVSAVVIRMS